MAGVIAFAALTLMLVWGAAPVPAQQEGAEMALPARASGEELYLAACSGCHGVKGDGKGLGAPGFEQPATDFRNGVYKFRTTPLGELPTDADLVRSIRIGMPGTEMVPFGQVMSEAQMAAVAAYLKTFSDAFEDAEQPEPAELPTTRPFPPSEASVAAGQEVWEDQGCADCHLERGQGTEEETDDFDNRVYMVPFQLGYYKSGPSDLDLYRSIATGMNGTTMPSYLEEELSPEAMWQLVDFIRSLADPPGYFGKSPSGFGYGQ